MCITVKRATRGISDISAEACDEGTTDRSWEQGARMIFVFGSNLAGRHGAGSAKAAKESWGAIYGQGEGRQGQSYGIPTKDRKLRTLPFPVVVHHVKTFLDYAGHHPEETFHVVKIGCGLAGLPEGAMKRIFYDAPANCQLPEGWRA